MSDEPPATEADVPEDASQLDRRIRDALRDGCPPAELAALPRAALARRWLKRAERLCMRGLDRDSDGTLGELLREVIDTPDEPPWLTRSPVNPVGALVLAGSLTCLLWLVGPGSHARASLAGELLLRALFAWWLWLPALSAYVIARLHIPDAELSRWLRTCERLMLLPWLGFGVYAQAGFSAALLGTPARHSLIGWLIVGASVLGGLAIFVAQLLALVRLLAIRASPRAGSDDMIAVTCLLVASVPGLAGSAFAGGLALMVILP